VKLLADIFLWFSRQWWSALAEALFWTWYLGLLFSSYASFHRARLAGTLRAPHWFVLAPVLAQGYPLDIAWNVLVGSPMYREVPWAESWKPWTWTFTERCIRHVRDVGWRGDIARWWQGMLNALAPGHV
jgi:hypothetical protein